MPWKYELNVSDGPLSFSFYILLFPIFSSKYSTRSPSRFLLRGGMPCGRAAKNTGPGVMKKGLVWTRNDNKVTYQNNFPLHPLCQNLIFSIGGIRMIFGMGTHTSRRVNIKLRRVFNSTSGALLPFHKNRSFDELCWFHCDKKWYKQINTLLQSSSEGIARLRSTFHLQSWANNR